MRGLVCRVHRALWEFRFSVGFFVCFGACGSWVGKVLEFRIFFINENL